MRFPCCSLVGGMLCLSACVRSSPVHCAFRDVWERDGGEACVIDLRDHAVTRALGGSEFAYYSTPSSECGRLYKTLDEAEQMWTNGDHNRSIALFYQVYSPQASPDEVGLVQDFVAQAQDGQIAKRDSEINALVFGSILDSELVASSETSTLARRNPPWVLSKAHRITRRFAEDLAHAYAVSYFGYWVNGCCPRSDCYNGACLSWAKDIPKWNSPIGNAYIQDLLSKYPGSSTSAISAHSWDQWGNRGTICVSNRPDGCTNHG